ncbi:MAG: class I SAM-dependent methyltransferase [Ferruginibacter sp.]
MHNQNAYNQWASSYNQVENITRDLELLAKKEILKSISFSNVIELGCGTGKNTHWLLQSAKSITAVDFSEKMLAKAKENIQNENVHFVQSDINEPWDFVKQKADLITCSLVLEHIRHLKPVFKKANEAIINGGYFYIGELHPFKQYSGSKARFQKEDDIVILDCYTHHLSEYTTLALANGFELINFNEWFDEVGEKNIPRILTLLFKKIEITGDG